MNIVVAILCATSKVNIVKFFITAILFQNIYLRDKPISPNYLKKKHKRLTPPRISLKLFTSFFLFSSICLVRSSLSVRSLIDLCVFWAFIVFITKQFFFSLSRFWRHSLAFSIWSLRAFICSRFVSHSYPPVLCTEAMLQKLFTCCCCCCWLALHWCIVIANACMTQLVRVLVNILPLPSFTIMWIFFSAFFCFCSSDLRWFSFFFAPDRSTKVSNGKKCSRCVTSTHFCIKSLKCYECHAT